MCTSGLRLKAFAGFPTQRRSKIISFMAKSSLSCNEIKRKKNVKQNFVNFMTCCVSVRYSILVLTGSYMKYYLTVWHLYYTVQYSTGRPCVYLCNKLDDFDKNIERHVSWYHTAWSFGKKCCHNSVEAAVDTEKRIHYEDTHLTFI